MLCFIILHNHGSNVVAFRMEFPDVGIPAGHKQISCAGEPLTLVFGMWLLAAMM
ncbi:MAG TPA: hypothetical protein VEH07_05770 [Alphaproteobacteria bacterium]|nr:hypothetical protein [Alphaproteobacteria bacterium]